VAPINFITGSGGGDQVAEALKVHAGSITAVEINPVVNDIVSKRISDYWRNLFHQPEVHLVEGEERSFIAERENAIISVHTISNAAVASGALSLAESYVLTREAFADYLDHLKPDGGIYFTHPEFQIPRLLATAGEAFAERGLGPVNNRALAYTESAMSAPGRLSFDAGLVVQKSESRPEQLKQIKDVFARRGFGRSSLSNPLRAGRSASPALFTTVSSPHPTSVRFTKAATCNSRPPPTTSRSSTSTRAGRESAGRPSWTSSRRGSPWEPGWRLRASRLRRSRF
jgi:hypothetical protein